MSDTLPMPMGGRWLFLAAYACSGLAGLIYEVTWTRLLTLHMGHTTAAASTVLAAFMGGLAAGAWGGGRAAARLTPVQALRGYALLEISVILMAFAIPFELSGLASLLRWAYDDGAGMLFPVTRLVVCLAVVFAPAVALGATFPLAVRWYVGDAARAGGAGGRLYAANTMGAAVGALAAGVLLVPAIGVSGTTLVGMTASGLSMVLALVIARRAGQPSAPCGATAGNGSSAPQGRPAKGTRARRGETAPVPLSDDYRLAAGVLALTGIATFMYEIAWTRVFSMIVGPSTYAFAATLSAFICGLAAGSFVGAWIAGRARQPALPLALMLTAAAVAASWACAHAGGPLLRGALTWATASDHAVANVLVSQSLRAAAIVLPSAIALGAAFPLALTLALGRDQPAARSLSTVYAINTLGAVAGALATGFIFVPRVGLQNTIRIATALLLAGAVLIALRALGSMRARAAALLPALAALAFLILAPSWDRELLASGVYKYARQVAPGVDVEAALKAGTLLYYREGATATVSVKRLTGDLSLAIDGKVDASTLGDMLTQKVLAHLPLLMHPDPRAAAIIGLGSGVTLSSALAHPIRAIDVIEISPEVVEASRHFAVQNRNALDDPRTRLITGDGRSHLALSPRRYDVIISEPSNPWMAGVAALFTQEFFTILRGRLLPGGIVCQWAHTYDISPADLRSIVATFSSVFPNGTMWLVGNGDLLLVGAVDPLESRLENIERAWRRPLVADDLRAVAVSDPFALLSLFIGGADQLREYGAGAPVQTDDRMALEFTGPRALNIASAENLASLRALLPPSRRPGPIALAMSRAGVTEWRNRATMMLKAAAYEAAYDDYARALALDPADPGTQSGLIRAAVASRREAEATRLLTEAVSARPAVSGLRIALSKLRAGVGDFDTAVDVARAAVGGAPGDPGALEQLASLYAESGDAARLEPVVRQLQGLFPDRPGSRYYAAAWHFLRGELTPALDSAQQAIATAPPYAGAYNLLGAIHARQGAVQPAREAFQAALRLDPHDSTAYANLGLLELEAGNADAAARLFAEVLSLDPSSAAGRDGLARARAAAL